ncbi:acyltransferase family protein [Leifsonia poae]|uniref:acyltransferase family protein n=1 Tax=Leifsonia poae TaxID=110933 RepID=UPI003D6674CA
MTDSTIQATAPGPSPDRRPAGRRTRPEIQALRAVAVAAVVLYHFWPPVVTGGYVGVDVFFAISGFLITGHLLREVAATDRIGLAQFWARRARRLLPASLLVLLVTAIAVLVWVPSIFWLPFFRETIASALYVENWTLAADSVDYLAANAVPTAVQHYWSLSAEEQFYLIWPLVILAGLWASTRVRRFSRRRVIFVVLSVVTAASLAASVALTTSSPSVAYFITPTRAWEFGLGGLLALALGTFDEGMGRRIGQRIDKVRPILAWAGWIAIAYAVFRFSAATPFPGYTALLPVGGALLVIAAGSPARWWAPTSIVGIRPVQWVGDVSYSIYLWHWPLLIVAPYVVGHASLTLIEKVALLALTVVLAWATKRWVEDPVRRARLFTARKPRWTFWPPSWQ